MLDYLPRNSRITVFLEPYSSALACILTFYAALYMQGNGMDARQIGLIATIAAMTGMLNQFVAAPITNRLGRRRTLLLFSVICWSIPLLLWTLAAGFTLFLLAAVIFSFSRITSVAWYCVATEDVCDDHKSKIFGLLFITGSIGGLATAFAGPALEKFGLVPSMRFLYGFAFVSMTLMFIIRHVLLTETRAGSELNDLHAGMTLGQTFRRHLSVVAASLKDREFRRLTLVYMLFNFAFAMSFVQILFINNVLKLTLTEISMMPPVTAIVSVTLFRFVVPRFRKTGEKNMLAMALAVYVSGLFLLLLIPHGNLGLTLLASALIAAGAYLFQVCINAAMNNRMGLLHKADVYSAIQLLVTLAVIPAGYVAGKTFVLNPQLSVSLIGLIAAAAAVLTLLPLKMEIPAIAKPGKAMNEGNGAAGPAASSPIGICFHGTAPRSKFSKKALLLLSEED